MRQIEYKYDEIKMDELTEEGEWEGYLNKMGAEGWILCVITNNAVAMSVHWRRDRS